MSRLDAALRRAKTGVVVPSPLPAPVALPPEITPQALAPQVAVTPVAPPVAPPVAVPPAAAPPEAEIAHVPPVSSAPVVEPPAAPAVAEPRSASPVADTSAAPPAAVELSKSGSRGRAVATTFRGFHAEHLEKLVVSPSVPQPLRETYRRLAATLHGEQSEHGTKVLMISSAVPDEGKTLTAANIALTLSESFEFRVLLIDADLRRPSLDALFSTGRVQGLNEALTSVPPQQIPVIRVSKWLSLLPAGKPDPDPMSSLTSERMRRLLSEAASQYDWVIIDTPPVGILTDAKLLGSIVDGVLLVVRAGKTPSTLVQQAIDALGRNRILGVVLNRTETRHTFGAYSAYGSDYYYGTKR